MRWVFQKHIPSNIFQNLTDIPEVVAQILYNRGISGQKTMEEFLEPDYDEGIHDPFLFRDMEKAVARIQKAIRDKEKIVAHGDYDADGVCGAAVLVDGLRQLGAQVEAYLPHREREGYGVNKETVRQLAKNGTNLIITADCGISNQPEIELARELGMDVIVTDHHHEPLQMPTAAYAIINPSVSTETYPFRGLAGVGVAFKLISALYQKDNGKTVPKGAEKWLLDLVAISTITDMMPLLGENRVLVKYGLIVLRKTRRFGLHALAQAVNTPIEKFDTDHIGFRIGPRLNAAGRLQHADIAFQAMITKSAGEAQKLAQRLEQINNDRRLVTELISTEVEQQLGEVAPEQKALFAFGNNWPIGVVGLVAGKVAQKYNRPVFILGEVDGNIVASGRSVPELNIVEVLQASAKYYAKYGGHAAACGFTLKYKEDFDEWKQFMHDLIKEKLDGADTTQMLKVESEIRLTDITWELWQFLEKLAPFGQAHPKPVYAARQVTVQQVKALGKTGKHLRLVVEQGGMTKQSVGFGFGEWSQKLSPGQKIDIAFTVDLNEWNGQRELQLKILDIHV